MDEHLVDRRASRRDPEELSPLRALRLYGRAVALRCPRRGGLRTKTLWLASDILIRPVTAEEMAWHRANEETAMRPYAER